jgi:hypothetical protein
VPEAALDSLNTHCPAKFWRRRGPTVKNSAREFTVELRTVVLSVKATHASTAFIGAKRVIDALSSALCRIVEPDTELMLEECGKAADLGFSVAVCVKDSGKRTRNEILANTVLAKSAPLYVPKKDVAHRVK